MKIEIYRRMEFNLNSLQNLKTVNYHKRLTQIATLQLSLEEGLRTFQNERAI